MRQHPTLHPLGAAADLSHGARHESHLARRPVLPPLLHDFPACADVRPEPILKGKIRIVDTRVAAALPSTACVGDLESDDTDILLSIMQAVQEGDVADC